MYKLDDSDFPILVQSTDDTELTLDVLKQFETKLVSVIERGEPFGIIARVTSDTEARSSKEVTKFSNDMFKRLKPDMARLCVGYAGVTHIGKWLKLYKPIANVAIRNRMGCDGAVFEHEDQARAWLADKLHARSHAAVR
jgi:hypothetical protein